MMDAGSAPDSRTLILAAVILSCTLSAGKSASELGRLAAFFTVVGDTLALLALQPELTLTDE